MKPGIDDEVDASAEDLKSEDEGLMDTLYTEKKDRKAKKITESAEGIIELFTTLDNFKYKNEASTNADIRREAFDEALEILGITSKSREAKEAWTNINEMEEPMAEPDMEVPGSEEYEVEEDAFFDEAKKRSNDRKAYLKTILNEEDTPVMADQSEVEELMGLKIMKKMGEDPKLVESKSKKFVENYKGKKAFNFKELLNNGFLG